MTDGTRSNPIGGGAPSAKPVKGAYLILALLFAVGMLNYLDRMLFAALMPLIKKEFILSDTQLGLLTGFTFSLTYAVIGMPLGRLSDSRSRKWIITCSTAAWGLFTAACGMANSYALLFLMRMGVAVGEAGSLPASYSMLSDLFPPARRNWALGVLIPSISIGVIAGFSLGGWIGESHGWRTTFVIVGLPGLLLALVSMLLIKEPERSAMDAIVARPMKLRESYVSLARNRMFLWVSLAAGTNGYMAAGIIQWLPSFYIRSHHIPLATIGWIFGIAFGLGMGLGQFAGGWIGSRMAGKYLFAPLRLCAIANVLVFAIYLGVLWLPSFELSIVLMFVATFLGGLCHAPQSAAVQNAVPSSLRGTAHSVYAFVTVLVGQGIGPLIAGMMSDAFAKSSGDQSLRIALTLSLILPIIAAFSAWRASIAGRTHVVTQPDP